MEHCQAGHQPIIPLDQPAVTDIHAPAELRDLLGLHLHMDQYPLFFAAAPINFDQFVTASLGLADDLLLLLVQRLIVPRPVDVGVSIWKEKRHE